MAEEQEEESTETRAVRRPRTRNNPVQASEEETLESEDDNLSCWSENPPTLTDKRFTKVYEIPKSQDGFTAVQTARPENHDDHLPVPSMDDEVSPVPVAEVENPAEEAEKEVVTENETKPVPKASTEAVDDCLTEMVEEFQDDSAFGNLSGQSGEKDPWST